MASSGAERIACYTIAYAFVVFLLAPIAWLLATSFKDQLAIFQQPPVLIGSGTLRNYIDVLSDRAFTRSFFNSVVVSSGTVTLTMLLAVPAAYGLAQLQARTMAGFLSWVLLIRAAPGMVYVIPFFVAFNEIGLIDTWSGLMLVNAVFTIPLAIWILVPFFEVIPSEIQDAARIDGASLRQVFWFVALPLTLPGLASTAILVFIFSWNEFLFALALTRFEAETAAVSILRYMAFQGTEWGKVAAAGILIMLPVLLFSVLIRKYFVQTTAGGVKG